MPTDAWHSRSEVADDGGPGRLVGAENLSAIFNQVFMGLAEVSVQGRVIAANERFCQLIERTPEAVVLQELRLRDVVHSGDVQECERTLAQIASGVPAVVREVRFMTPDKRVVWTEVAASPLGGDPPESAAFVVTEIGSRKRAEARARETERRFREVADAAPVFIWTSGTDRRRRHTWVNAHWAQFRGQQIEAELGSGWTVGVHPDDVAGCLETYSAAFDRRGPFTAEYRLRRYDGTYRWLLDTGTPIHDEHGRFVGYIGSSVDISERKASEGQREALLSAERQARADAERANQLKDEFLSILSHELRTPLNAVLGWVHLLRTSIDPDGQLGRGLNVIERNARLQSRMVDDLLDMGGVIAGKMRLEKRRVALGRVVEGVVESLQPAFIEKGVMLRRQPLGDAGDIEGDPNRLHQVIWNLLSNSLKFTPAGGEVTVEVCRCGPEVQIIVRDNGQGIAPEFLPYVFDRFRQGDPSTRRTQGGLGIGLALVKSLAELHSGSVSVSSAGTGQGSTFTVTLPLLPPLPVAPAPPVEARIGEQV